MADCETTEIFIFGSRWISTRWFFTGFNIFEPQVMMHVYLIQLVTKKLAESVESPSLLRCWNSTHVLLVIGFWFLRSPNMDHILTKYVFKKKKNVFWVSPICKHSQIPVFMIHHIILQYIMLYYIILYHILLYYVISYYIMLYYIIYIIYYIILNSAVYTHRMYPLL